MLLWRDMSLFPFGEYWWLYGLFTVGVLALLAIDLGLFHKEPKPVGFREAGAWVAVWVSLGLAFNVALYFFARRIFAGDARLMRPGFDPDAAAFQAALEFLTGYLIEYALSVDNIFVFVMVLGYFAVPPAYQHRVLFYGILGALIFRGIFITLGTLLIQIHWVLYVFGAFLIVTGIRLAIASETNVDPEKNPLLRLLRRLMPITHQFRGQRFFVKEQGRLHATPLLVALVALEATDIVFAIDSVPAIFAITREPFLVFTSNIFAILGLRSLYFLLGGAVEKFHLLRYGLAFVLVFVGLKMVWLDNWYGGKFPIGWSLAIVASAIALSIVVSLLFPAAHADSESPVPRSEKP
jgi:tellurite resistance protein TerC